MDFYGIEFVEGLPVEIVKDLPPIPTKPFPRSDSTSFIYDVDKIKGRIVYSTKYRGYFFGTKYGWRGLGLGSTGGTGPASTATGGIGQIGGYGSPGPTGQTGGTGVGDNPYLRKVKILKDQELYPDTTSQDIKIYHFNGTKEVVLKLHDEFNRYIDYDSSIIKELNDDYIVINTGSSSNVYSAVDFKDVLVSDARRFAVQNLNTDTNDIDTIALNEDYTPGHEHFLFHNLSTSCNLLTITKYITFNGEDQTDNIKSVEIIDCSCIKVTLNPYSPPSNGYFLLKCLEEYSTEELSSPEWYLPNPQPILKRVEGYECYVTHGYHSTTGILDPDDFTVEVHTEKDTTSLTNKFIPVFPWGGRLPFNNFYHEKLQTELGPIYNPDIPYNPDYNKYPIIHEDNKWHSKSYLKEPLYEDNIGERGYWNFGCKDNYPKIIGYGYDKDNLFDYCGNPLEDSYITYNILDPNTNSYNQNTIYTSWDYFSLGSSTKNDWSYDTTSKQIYYTTQTKHDLNGFLYLNKSSNFEIDTEVTIFADYDNDLLSGKELPTDYDDDSIAIIIAYIPPEDISNPDSAHIITLERRSTHSETAPQFGLLYYHDNIRYVIDSKGSDNSSLSVVESPHGYTDPEKVGWRDFTSTNGSRLYVKREDNKVICYTSDLLDPDNNLIEDTRIEINFDDTTSYLGEILDLGLFVDTPLSFGFGVRSQCGATYQSTFLTLSEKDTRCRAPILAYPPQCYSTVGYDYEVHKDYIKLMFWKCRGSFPVISDTTAWVTVTYDGNVHPVNKNTKELLDTTSILDNYTRDHLDPNRMCGVFWEEQSFQAPTDLCYTHIQSEPEHIWRIQHNLNRDFTNDELINDILCYDISGNLIQPKEIYAKDRNNLVIVFNTSDDLANTIEFDWGGTGHSGGPPPQGKHIPYEPGVKPLHKHSGYSGHTGWTEGSNTTQRGFAPSSGDVPTLPCMDSSQIEPVSGSVKIYCRRDYQYIPKCLEDNCKEDRCKELYDGCEISSRLTAKSKPWVYTYHHDHLKNWEWVIRHNLGTKNIGVVAYDLNNIRLGPDEVEIIDENTVKLKFVYYSNPYLGRDDMEYCKDPNDPGIIDLERVNFPDQKYDTDLFVEFKCPSGIFVYHRAKILYYPGSRIITEIDPEYRDGWVKRDKCDGPQWEYTGSTGIPGYWEYKDESLPGSIPLIQLDDPTYKGPIGQPGMVIYEDEIVYYPTAEHPGFIIPVNQDTTSWDGIGYTGATGGIPNVNTNFPPNLTEIIDDLNEDLPKPYVPNPEPEEVYPDNTIDLSGPDAHEEGSGWVWHPPVEAGPKTPDPETGGYGWYHQPNTNRNPGIWMFLLDISKFSKDIEDPDDHGGNTQYYGGYEIFDGIKEELKTFIKDWLCEDDFIAIVPFDRSVHFEDIEIKALVDTDYERILDEIAPGDVEISNSFAQMYHAMFAAYTFKDKYDLLALPTAVIPITLYHDTNSEDDPNNPQYWLEPNFVPMTREYIGVYAESFRTQIYPFAVYNNGWTSYESYEQVQIGYTCVYVDSFDMVIYHHIGLDETCRDGWHGNRLIDSRPRYEYQFVTRWKCSGPSGYFDSDQLQYVADYSGGIDYYNSSQVYCDEVYRNTKDLNENFTKLGETVTHNNKCFIGWVQTGGFGAVPGHWEFTGGTGSLQGKDPDCWEYIEGYEIPPKGGPGWIKSYAVGEDSTPNVMMDILVDFGETVSLEENEVMYNQIYSFLQTYMDTTSHPHYDTTSDFVRVQTYSDVPYAYYNSNGDTPYLQPLTEYNYDHLIDDDWMYYYYHEKESDYPYDGEESFHFYNMWLTLSMLRPSLWQYWDPSELDYDDWSLHQVVVIGGPKDEDDPKIYQDVINRAIQNGIHVHVVLLKLEQYDGSIDTYWPLKTDLIEIAQQTGGYYFESTPDELYVILDYLGEMIKGGSFFEWEYTGPPAYPDYWEYTCGHNSNTDTNSNSDSIISEHTERLIQEDDLFIHIIDDNDYLLPKPPPVEFPADQSMPGGPPETLNESINPCWQWKSLETCPATGGNGQLNPGWYRDSTSTVPVYTGQTGYWDWVCQDGPIPDTTSYDSTSHITPDPKQLICYNPKDWKSLKEDKRIGLRLTGVADQYSYIHPINYTRYYTGGTGLDPCLTEVGWITTPRAVKGKAIITSYDIPEVNYKNTKTIIYNQHDDNVYVWLINHDWGYHAPIIKIFDQDNNLIDPSKYYAKIQYNRVEIHWYKSQEEMETDPYNPDDYHDVPYTDTETHKGYAILYYNIEYNNIERLKNSKTLWAGTGGTGATYTGPSCLNGSTGATGGSGTIGYQGHRGCSGGTGGTGITISSFTGGSGGTGGTGMTGVPGDDGGSGGTGYTGGTGPVAHEYSTGGTGGTGGIGPSGGTGGVGTTGGIGGPGLTGGTGGSGGDCPSWNTGGSGGTGHTGGTGGSGSTGPKGIDGELVSEAPGLICSDQKSVLRKFYFKLFSTQWREIITPYVEEDGAQVNNYWWSVDPYIYEDYFRQRGLPSEIMNEINSLDGHEILDPNDDSHWILDIIDYTNQYYESWNVPIIDTNIVDPRDYDFGLDSNLDKLYINLPGTQAFYLHKQLVTDNYDDPRGYGPHGYEDIYPYWKLNETNNIVEVNFGVLGDTTSHFTLDNSAVLPWTEYGEYMHSYTRDVWTTINGENTKCTFFINIGTISYNRTALHMLFSIIHYYNQYAYPFTGPMGT